MFLHELTNNVPVYTGLTYQNIPHYEWKSIYGKKFFPWLRKTTMDKQELCGYFVFGQGQGYLPCRTEKVPVICEKRVKHCMSGWEENGNSCYKLISHLLDHEEASNACNDEGGFLASFGTRSEQNNIRDWVPNRYYWIGVILNYGSWVWTDGTSGTPHVETMPGMKGSYAIYDREKNKIFQMSHSDKRYRFQSICKYNGTGITFVPNRR